jgi:hypothetical protein
MTDASFIQSYLLLEATNDLGFTSDRHIHDGKLQIIKQRTAHSVDDERGIL